MLKLKKIFEDLIEYAYPEHPKKAMYKRFYIEMLDKNMKSRHGDYTYATHHIRIFNMYRDDNAIVATSVHELAHHVDYVNRGKSDHGPEFYAVFKVLLHGALDMSLFSKEEFLQANKDASDSNKIAAMIGEYKPSAIGYKANKRIIEVRNAFAIKDRLKTAGYSWNGINKTWEKEIAETEIAAEQDILDRLKAEYSIDNFSLSFNGGKQKIWAINGGYEYRSQLSAGGFKYDAKKKKWYIESSPEDIKKIRQKYPGVTFSL